MKNFIGEGNRLSAIAPAGGVVSGEPAVIGAVFMVPVSSADEGDGFAALWKGVFALPKDATVEASQFEKAYWDDAGEVVTSTATENREIGVFYQSAEAAADEIDVLLTGVIV